MPLPRLPGPTTPKIRFMVWPEVSCRVDAVPMEAFNPWEAAEVWAMARSESFDDDVTVLVEHPDGQVERIKVEREVIVEYSGMPERTVFDAGRVRIMVKNEEFFWSLLECKNPTLKCMDESCPVHGKHGPHGPFESWDEAFLDAKKECSVPDDGKDDPNT